MSCLLDVNALVALGFLQYEFHECVAAWLQASVSKGTVELATCAITELVFRVLTQAPQYRFTVSDARELLLRLKAAQRVRFSFLADDQGISRLPGWVKNGKQTTDGHLALSKGAVPATLDRRVPGALVIPQ